MIWYTTSMKKISLFIILFVLVVDCWANYLVTIDDSPAMTTSFHTSDQRRKKIVGYLTEHKLKNTILFMITGYTDLFYLKKTLNDYGELVEVGNHSHSHKNFSTLSSKEQVSEINKSQKIFKQLNLNPRYFRFPMLHDTDDKNVNKYLKDNNLKKLDITFDSLDWFVQEFLQKNPNMDKKILNKLLNDYVNVFDTYYSKAISISNSSGLIQSQIILFHENDVFGFVGDRLLSILKKYSKVELAINQKIDLRQSNRRMDKLKALFRIEVEKILNKYEKKS